MNPGDVPPNTDPALAEATVWLNQNLTTEGGRGSRVVTNIARGFSVAAGATVLVLVIGVIAIVLAVAALRDHPVFLAVAVVLCLPAVIAPILARRNLVRMRNAFRQPDEATNQLNDLITGITGSHELNELAGRARRRELADDPGPQGWYRGTTRVVELFQTVLGRAEPDPARHQLLTPFTPSSSGRTMSALTWCGWGLLLAAAIALASVTALAA